LERQLQVPKAMADDKEKADKLAAARKRVCQSICQNTRELPTPGMQTDTCSFALGRAAEEAEGEGWWKEERQS